MTDYLRDLFTALWACRGIIGFVAAAITGAFYAEAIRERNKARRKLRAVRDQNNVRGDWIIRRIGQSTASRAEKTSDLVEDLRRGRIGRRDALRALGYTPTEADAIERMATT